MFPCQIIPLNWYLYTDQLQVGSAEPEVSWSIVQQLHLSASFVF